MKYTSAGGGCCAFAMALSGLVVAVLAFQMAKENKNNIDILATAAGVPISAATAVGAGAGGAVLWKFLVAITTLHFLMGSAAEPEPQKRSSS